MSDFVVVNDSHVDALCHVVNINAMDIPSKPEGR